MLKKLMATAVLGTGLTAAAVSADAATYQIKFFDGALNVIGTSTFDATTIGGATTPFTIALSGIDTFTVTNGIFAGLPAGVQGSSAANSTINNLPTSITFIASSLSIFTSTFQWTANVTTNACAPSCVLSSANSKGTYSLAAIPLPASIPLFAAGLAAVGFASRRKTRSA